MTYSVLGILSAETSALTTYGKNVNLIPCSAATSLNFYGDPISLEHQFHPLMLRVEQCVLS